MEFRYHIIIFDVITVRCNGDDVEYDIYSCGI